MPHSCGPATHFTAINTHSIQYLMPHHRAAVIDSPKISAKQLQSNERLQYFNRIPYLQAYKVKQAILTEMWGDESESFAKFPACIKRFENADPRNFGAMLLDNSRLPFSALVGYVQRGLVFILLLPSRTHTKSRYRMMLLFARGIDANDQVIPLAWALVPIEESSWWSWLLRYLKVCYPGMDVDNYTFILTGTKIKGLRLRMRMRIKTRRRPGTVQYVDISLWSSLVLPQNSA